MEKFQNKIITPDIVKKKNPRRGGLELNQKPLKSVGQS